MLCMGVLRPASFQSLQLAEPVCIVCPERGADLSRLCWLGCNESVTHVCSLRKGVYWHLPELQRREAQSASMQVFKYKGSEAVLKVQLQRRAGKNHV